MGAVIFDFVVLMHCFVSDKYNEDKDSEDTSSGKITFETLTFNGYLYV